MKGRKPAKLQGLEQYDFEKLARETGNFRTKKRFLAFAHIKENKSYTEVAKMVRVNVRTLMNWVSQFRQRGIDGLKDTFGGGTRPHVPRDEHQAFKQAVIKLQKDRPGGRIRATDVRELIQKMYGVQASASSVYATLKRVGLVWITGRSQEV